MLKKSLYGLKQTPICWNKAFNELKKSAGFKQSSADPCFHNRIAGTLCIIAVYVADGIIATNTDLEMQQVKQLLQSQFKMKDIGELHYCQGISNEHDKAGKSFELHQKHYHFKLLKKYNLHDDKLVSTSADSNVRLRKDNIFSKAVNSVMYKSIVGSLLYAAIAATLNIP